MLQAIKLPPPGTEVARNDLRGLTNDMVDLMLSMIAGCKDEAVTRVPDDPEANGLRHDESHLGQLERLARDA